MPRRRSSTSGSLLEKEARDDDSGAPAVNKRLTEYEIQRLSRIAENRKRMAALGLPQIAGSLMTGPSRRSSGKSDVKGKRKLDVEDEDYEPRSDEEGGVNDDDDDDDFDGADVDEEEDQDYSASGPTRKKRKKTSTRKKKTPVKKVPIKSDSVDDEDEFMQAIALSLQGKNEIASPGKVEDFTSMEQPRRVEVHRGSQKRKSKTSFSSRVKMTEDELVLHFFQFDEDGKGSINIKDLAKVAIAHDFTWTDSELVDMIRFFDADGDGKLSLDDFRKIAQRCNMMQGPE